MIRIVLLGASALLATPALAQTAPAPAPATGDDRVTTRAELEASIRARLVPADADKDGTVTGDEMHAYAPVRAKAEADEAFVAMDADRNGQLSRAEYDTYQANRRGGRGGGNWGGMGGGGREMMMTMRGGGGVVIADAVSDALQQFDATDANKDGGVTPQERQAMRAKLDAARGRSGD